MRDDALYQLGVVPEIASICNELFDVHLSMIAGAVDAAEAGRSNIVSDAYKRHRQLFEQLRITAASSGIPLRLLDKSAEPREA